VQSALRTDEDWALIALSGAHAALLLTAPSVPLIAIGLWWNANTVSHNFIHRPFFRARPANRLFSLWLSLLLGLPQSLWRARHLRHHAGGAETPTGSRSTIVLEGAAVLVLFGVLGAFAPHLFLSVYLPGWATGLGLCFLQGHYEHARGTTSHYGRLYNLLFFNDGYHVEHHERPGVHWSQLPRGGRHDDHNSRWPPVVRWMELLTLDSLESLVVRSPRLQAFVLDRHLAAMARVLAGREPIRRVTIVGGGLFPRTALILRRLLPGAALTVIDSDVDHLNIARRFLDDKVRLVHATYRAEPVDDVDLLIIPLAFSGARAPLYDQPPAKAVLIHDWIWSRRGRSAPVSWLLVKRLNLVTRPG